MCLKVTDTQSFIKKAKEIWGDQYDYSQVVYVKSSVKVLITCRKHKLTWKCTPNNHTHKTNPRGCPLCGRERQIEKATKSFQDFVADARKAHGMKYEYDSENYSNAKGKIKITCPFHGEFFQTPDAHYNQKQGCPSCAQERITQQQLLPIEEINRRLSKKSDGMVTIVPETFKRVNSEADFICLKHGGFRKLVNTALNKKYPCPECGQEARPNRGHTTESFTKLIKKKFGNKYKIINFKYEDKTSVVTLHCKEHGDFCLQAGSIYRSPGCRDCAYIASIDNRVAGLKKSHEATLEERKQNWIEKAKLTHGNFYDYSQVDYKTARDKVIIKCPYHSAFKQAPSTHLVSGCKKCASDDLQGRYTEKYFKDFPERKRRPARLYYLEFSYGVESFYKVGITVTTISERHAMIKTSIIDYEILGELKTTLYDAFLKEQEILESHGDKYRYTPDIEGFDNRKSRIGTSECFSKKLSQRTFTKYFER